MKLTIELGNVRRFDQVKFQFDGPTILIGPNGVGKTTVLEALHYASVGRSYRTQRDRELVAWESDWARIAVAIDERDRLERTLRLTSDESLSKQVKHNGASVQFVRSLGILRTVVFAPELIEIVTGSPKVRRRYLDVLLSSIDRLYAEDLLSFQHALRQRNALLAARIEDERQYEAWEAALARSGTQIWNKRRALVAFLGELLHPAYQEVASEGPRVVSLRFQAQLDDTTGYAEALAERRRRDLRFAETSLGPHRDDMLFLFDGRPAISAASRGEQRSLLFALKCAELEFYRAKGDGVAPIILFDDLFSELDRARSIELTRLISAQPSIMTITDATELQPSLRKHATVVALAPMLATPVR